jgi:hypothetical protein
MQRDLRELRHIEVIPSAPDATAAFGKAHTHHERKGIYR